MTSSGGQTLTGGQNVQADRGSTVNYTVFQAAPAAEVDEDTLAEAETLLESLPLDALPAPTGLPQPSQMPLLRNRSFVGREADLKALATTLKAGGTAAVGQVPAVTGLGGLGKSQFLSGGGLDAILILSPRIIAQIVDPGLIIGTGIAFPTEQEHPIPAQIGHGVVFSCRGTDRRAFLRPGVVAEIIYPGLIAQSIFHPTEQKHLIPTDVSHTMGLPR